MEVSFIPTKLKTEYATDPIGLDCERPRLSWIIESSQRGFLQTAYRILVSTDLFELESGRGDIWDSGKVESPQSIFVVYEGLPLLSGQTYYWKVKVWDQEDVESGWSGNGWWTMGLLSRNDWKAKWIGLRYDDTAGDATENRPSAYLRKRFHIGKPVRRALVFTTALGLYELRLNGRRVGNEVLCPGWTDYNTRLQYQTYDVSALLCEGDNVIGGITGDGWYCGHLAWYGRNFYGEFPQLLMQLWLEFADGSVENVVTDESWTASRGAIRFSDMLMGELYDARLEPSGWDDAGFDDGEWVAAPVWGDYKGWLVASQSPPIRVTERRNPVSVSARELGVRIVDMGQNMVGWTRLTVRGREGTELRIRYGEVLNADMTLYTENLRKAKQTDTYILNGRGEEVYEPRFTFHGFRYVEISGLQDDTELIGITGCVLHNDMPETGSIVTSDSRVNRLVDNIRWTQRANFVSVPTDCPQRDERLGWTGDAQIFSRTGAFMMDISGFMAKFMTDIADAQRVTGAFTDIVPFLKGIPGWCSFVASAGWADAGVVIPRTMLHVYGDRRIVEEHYEAMKRWVNYLQRLNPDLLRTDTQYYGDWLSLEADTPLDLFATAYFAYSSKLLAEMADFLGNKQDADMYSRLFGSVKERFIQAFVSEDGKLAGDTQTGYAMALHMDLLPTNLRERAARHLVDDIERKDWHISTGIHGIKYLLPVLCDQGYPDVAYRLLLQDTYPGWLYSIRHGATTIWERWDGWTEAKGFQDPGMNSFNHYALGAIGEWLGRYLGGIDSKPGTYGFGAIVIRPIVGEGITSVQCGYESMYGMIRSEWSKDAASGELTLEVTVPANTTAEIHLPGAAGKQVTESGVPVPQQAGLTLRGVVGDALIVSAGSGTYRFVVPQ